MSSLADPGIGRVVAAEIQRALGAPASPHASPHLLLLLRRNRSRAVHAVRDAAWLHSGPGAEQARAHEAARRERAVQLWLEAARRVAHLVGGVRYPDGVEDGRGGQHEALLATVRAGGSRAARAV